MQDASTDDLVFDVATLVSVLSEAFTLQAGDIIATGTPGVHSMDTFNMAVPDLEQARCCSPG